MPSFFIHGGTQKTRAEKAKEILLDHYIYRLGEEGKRISIEEIREILPQLYLLPQKPWKKKGILITESQRMNPEAQNALLKTLEEHPPFLTFVLTAPSTRLLLPTVVSRCLIEMVNERSSNEDSEEEFALAKKIFSATAGQRLAIFEDKVGYQQQAINTFLDALEISLAENKDENFTLLPQIWKTKKLLQNPSANLKLTVDRLLLSW